MAYQAGTDRAIEFGAFLLAGVIALIFGVTDTVQGLGTYAECLTNQACFGSGTGSYFGELTQLITGLILLGIGGFMLLHARRAKVSVILVPPATS